MGAETKCNHSVALKKYTYTYTFDSEFEFSENQSIINFREEEHFSLGGRFSKSSTERESILEARKESLMAHARRFVYMISLNKALLTC